MLDAKYRNSAVPVGASLSPQMTSEYYFRKQTNLAMEQILVGTALGVWTLGMSYQGRYITVRLESDRKSYKSSHLCWCLDTSILPKETLQPVLHLRILPILQSRNRSRCQCLRRQAVSAVIRFYSRKLFIAPYDGVPNHRGKAHIILAKKDRYSQRQTSPVRSWSLMDLVLQATGM